MSSPPIPRQRPVGRLVVVRHGATAPNLAEVRCGGDLDEPMLEVGRAQALQAACRVAELDQGIGVIYTSDLQRTRETAAIIASALGGIEVIVAPGFGERRLGSWNLRRIDETEAALRAGETPPGGESSAEFDARIRASLPVLLPALDRRPLLVASKGVARMLSQILGEPARSGLANAEIALFDLARFATPHHEGRAA